MTLLLTIFALPLLLRPHQAWVALDQYVNVMCGGWADETLSARAWRNRYKSTTWAAAYRWINRLFFWQANHCEDAYRTEQLRLQSPPEYRL